MSATRCHILKLKCSKFDFGWGSAPDTAGGAYSAPPDLLVGFQGPTSTRREGRERNLFTTKQIMNITLQTK